MESINANILVVEDIAANLKLLIRILSVNGYTVRPAPTATLALAAVNDSPPDLIFLDIMLPDMDGYEVCRQFKLMPDLQDVPIIFISALDETLDKVKAFSLGGVDYITKPFQEAEVLARVKTHLTLYHLQQELQIKNEALVEINETLDEKVQARTIALATANAKLEAEIEQRKQNQLEKDHLLSVVRQQSDQLYTLTSTLLENQQKERYGLAQTLQSQVSHNLEQIKFKFDHIKQEIQATDTSPRPTTLSNHISEVQRHIQDVEQATTQLSVDLHKPAPSYDQLTQNPHFNLTPREQEVLHLLIAGKSNREIAEILNLAIPSIKTYRSRLMRKLDLDTLADLVKFAIRHNLTSL